MPAVEEMQKLLDADSVTPSELVEKAGFDTYELVIAFFTEAICDENMDDSLRLELRHRCDDLRRRFEET